ncbi:hypothetical protein Y027_4824 [Burkholderia pseudomallei TSV5]|nr:hypothetical protein DO65_5569 [Burkholderia pseudomallei]KGS24763.1 hypothetical protein X962_4857 [Burkholderia pseudomallei MSHR7343]KGS38138.1 hypothetical protein X945_4989 [Burkholderia pseudomallei ABCPW 107]KGS40396.1 hypothetical protein X992_4947 [Burkholderia pseudomallei MSHR5492]KGS76906.1 hypothetical protein X942_4838 [Burkholderia pseudomallei MSHR5596]KGX52561.1 hypothetical protein Y027_4824 [Burkholderia pseudomallei TSV5]KGX53316.1 hypothetical protein Y025_4689 [Burkho
MTSPSVEMPPGHHGGRLSDYDGDRGSLFF